MHERFLLWPINELEKKANNKTAIAIRNLKAKLNGLEHRFDYDDEKKLFCIVDGDSKHFFANRDRGFDLYRKGLSQRVKMLNDSYLLEHIEFKENDIVVDCGANYADLWLCLKGLIKCENYITFEPGKEEFVTICHNAARSRNYNLGLSNEKSERKLYINSKNADSSFIEPPYYVETVEMQTVTLASIVAEQGIDSIKLLKLEAEGFEPEVLEGSISILPLIEYIAIDGSYERGVSQEETFSLQTNLLTRNGFEMVGVCFGWGRALFRNLGH